MMLLEKQTYSIREICLQLSLRLKRVLLYRIWMIPLRSSLLDILKNSQKDSIRSTIQEVHQALKPSKKDPLDSLQFQRMI